MIKNEREWIKIEEEEWKSKIEGKCYIKFKSWIIQVF